MFRFVENSVCFVWQLYAILDHFHGPQYDFFGPQWSMDRSLRTSAEEDIVSGLLCCNRICVQLCTDVYMCACYIEWYIER